VGPITAQYRGAARLVERDDDGHRAVLRAEGRDTRGQGKAHATVTARLTAVGAATEVRVETDLAITGKVAQFGRGMLGDVSSKLLAQFVDALHADLLHDRGAAPAPAPAGDPAAASPTVAAGAPRPVEAVDLLDVVGGPVLRRAAKVAAAAAVVVVVVVWARRARAR
jgi:hypothetical protein